jgi:hypothetical protein
VASDTVYLWPREHRSWRPLILKPVTADTGKRRVCLIVDVLRRADQRRAGGGLLPASVGHREGVPGGQQTLAHPRLHGRAAELAAREVAGVFLGSWAPSLLNRFARGRRGLAQAVPASPPGRQKTRQRWPHK